MQICVVITIKKAIIAATGMKNNILKYLSNNATAQELDRLSDWILIEGNERIFDEYVQLHLEITTSMNGPDTDKIKHDLLRKIKRYKYRKRIRRAMRYAGVALLFLTLGYFYQTESTIKTKSIGLVPKEESITITMANGKVETLDITKNKQVKDAEGNVIGTHDRSKLVYTGTSTTEELVYNTLYVPYGKQFDLILSDGTHIFLNSGTSLRYPVAFLAGHDRRVFLTGEAYFEVARDDEHPFVVNADEIQIEVLGTKFNISHYPEDYDINTVLVEGAVQLQLKDNGNAGSGPVLLEPGNKAEWHRHIGELSVINVDTSVYTAWIQGKLVFRNTSFRQIRQALERRYNVVIKNSNSDLDEQLFDATFDIETIDQVLESFNKSYAIEYTIVENEVIIK